jgi:hypothetical protein
MRTPRVGLRAALIVAATSVGIASCGGAPAAEDIARANHEAEASGSPFRWKAIEVNGRSRYTLVLGDLPSGPSRGDAVTKREVLRLIGLSEAGAGRGEPQVEDVKPLPNQREFWVLKSAHEGIGYLVHLRPSTQGTGVNIEIAGPQEYLRQ